METIFVAAPETPLLTDGSIAVRAFGGGGVRGRFIPSGFGIPSFLYSCADLPADNDVEFRGEVLSHTFPAGQFEWQDDGSFKVKDTCPSGLYTFTFRLFLDYVPQTPDVTDSVLVGAGGILMFANTLDPFASALSFTGSGGAFSVSSLLGDFVSALAFVGDSQGALPPTLSLARQYAVNPDAHLDAYNTQHAFATTWEKDPDSTLDYSIDWGARLDDDSDSISTMEVVPSAGVVVTAYAVIDRVTAVMVSGGAPGVLESVMIRIRTVGGRTDDRTINLLIRNL